MKKLIGFALIFALFAGMVFAQEAEKEDSKWKVGFMAQTATDFLYYTKLSANAEEKNGTGTTTVEYGKFNKGSLNIFNSDYLPTPDKRLLLSLSNSGESHEVYVDLGIDGPAGLYDSRGWYDGFSGVWQFLGKSAAADWWVKGNAGKFNAQVGTAGYGGYVNTFATWNDFLGWNTLCRFGVMKPGMTFLVGDDFRTWNEWGDILGIGVALSDSMRFSAGHKFGLGVPSYNNPAASRSSINASFMLNADSIADFLNLDVFYAIKGNDANTARRGGSYWENIFGVYAGLTPSEKLGLSVGVTANFNTYEKYAYTDGGKEKPGTVKAPMFIGIDLHTSIGGVPVVETLTFNNRFSLAGAKEASTKSDERIMNLNGVLSVVNQTQNWFAWETELKADIDYITIHLANRLGIFSTETKPTGSTNTVKETEDEVRLSVTASKSMGALTVTGGMFFGMEIESYKYDNSATKESTNISTTTLTFGVPILFKVAF